MGGGTAMQYRLTNIVEYLYNRFKYPVKRFQNLSVLFAFRTGDVEWQCQEFFSFRTMLEQCWNNVWPHHYSRTAK